MFRYRIFADTGFAVGDFQTDMMLGDARVDPDLASFLEDRRCEPGTYYGMLIDPSVGAALFVIEVSSRHPSLQVEVS